VVQKALRGFVDGRESLFEERQSQGQSRKLLFVGGGICPCACLAEEWGAAIGG